MFTARRRLALFASVIVLAATVAAAHPAGADFVIPKCNGKTATILANGLTGGTDHDDVIVGGPGDDIIYGGGGNDTICGGGGNDIIFPGTGDDYVQGGLGNDTIMIGNAAELNNDDLRGGDGYDFVDYTGIAYFNNALVVVNVKLLPAAGLEYGTARLAVNALPPGTPVAGTPTQKLRGIENVRGTNQDDRIVGDNNSNQLFGFKGDDYLNGKDGNVDHLYGGDGTDTCESYDKADTCEYKRP